jgi:peroxiredoxin
MQKLIVIAATLFALTSCDESTKKGPFELKGNFTNSKGETIYLEKLSGQQPVVVDSTVVDEKGDFSFTNYDPKIGFYRVKVTDQSFAMLVLDSADKVKLTGNINDLGNTYKVEGSAETTLFMQYNQLSRGMQMRRDSLQQACQMVAGNMGLEQLQQTNKELAQKRYDSLIKTMQEPYEAIVESENAKLADVIAKNTDKFASIIAIQALDPEKYFKVFVDLDANLLKKYPNNQNILMFHEMVSKSMAITVGHEAPEINLPDPNGKDIALSSLRGKIVLIDFWASWCKPCRAEMPNVVKTYKKYKDKGFEIYGVSLDQAKEAWVEAIQQDGITWPQVSDLKYWECVAARLYNVQGIPFTVLVDKEGKILGKNLRGEELDKAVELALAGKPIEQGSGGETVKQ